MAPGNAQLHDRFCLSEKATRKTKQRKVIKNRSFILVLTKGWLNIFGIEHFCWNLIIETIFGAFSKSSNKKSSVLQKHLLLVP